MQRYYLLALILKTGNGCVRVCAWEHHTAAYAVLCHLVICNSTYSLWCCIRQAVVCDKTVAKHALFKVVLPFQHYLRPSVLRKKWPAAQVTGDCIWDYHATKLTVSRHPVILTLLTSFDNEMMQWSGAHETGCMLGGFQNVELVHKNLHTLKRKRTGGLVTVLKSLNLFSSLNLQSLMLRWCEM